MTTQSQKQGQELLDSLVLELPKAKEDTNKVNLLNKLGKACEQTGDAGKELEFAGAALELATTLKWEKGQAAALLHVGSALDDLGDYAGALAQYSRAMSLFIKLGNQPGIAHTHNNTGIVRWSQGDHVAALSEFLAALKIYEGTGDKKGMARAYNAISAVHSQMGDLTVALENQRAALDIMEEADDKHGMATLYGNIGLTYQRMGDDSAALRNLVIGLRIKEEIGDKQGIATSYNNIGGMHWRSGNLPEAMKNYMLSLKIREDIGDTTGITSTCLNIGSAYDAMGASLEGKKWFTRSLSLAQRTGNKDMIRDSYDGLAEAAALSGDFEEAFTNYRLSIAYRDSLYNEENTKKLVQTQMRYEFDKKEAATKAEQDKKDALAAEALRRRELQRNATIGLGVLLALGGGAAYGLDRKRRKARFEKEAAVLETKALRAQMNPHFIFNVMQSVNSYLGDQDTEQARGLVSRFGKVMRLVLENSEHNAVPLAKDLEALRGYMEVERLRTKGKFDFILEVAPDLNVDEVRVPPLVVQPFLENAIWHGIMPKEGRGRILLRADQRAGELIFTVEDDGVGRGADGRSARPEHTSHGTTITRSRLELLSRETKRPAHFDYTDLHPGTRVVITLPLPNAA